MWDSTEPFMIFMHLLIIPQWWKVKWPILELLRWFKSVNSFILSRVLPTGDEFIITLELIRGLVITCFEFSSRIIIVVWDAGSNSIGCLRQICFLLKLTLFKIWEVSLRHINILYNFVLLQSLDKIEFGLVTPELFLSFLSLFYLNKARAL